jgi:hypothetical protein
MIVDKIRTGCTCRPGDPCYIHKTAAGWVNPQGQLERTEVIQTPTFAVSGSLPPPPAKNLPVTGFADIDQFLADTFEVMRAKGHDYRQGNDSDLLHNFRTVGSTVDEPMEKVWFTYFYKHYAAMCTYIKKGGQSESEPIEGRITDMIVYLVLFWKMVKEKKDA